MVIRNISMTSMFALLVVGSPPLEAEQSVPATEISNPNWSILMTPEGYSDVALDKRPGFEDREYLSGEWAAAIFYSGGSMPGGPIWLRKQWVFPCWVSNSNFSVVQTGGQDFVFDSPATNDVGIRLISKITNGDVEITIYYEMVDTATGIAQGNERASVGGEGASITSDRYVLMQRYSVKNVSGGPLGNVRFYHFLHGLKSGISLYDDRAYSGPLSDYRYDNTQKGTSLGFNSQTGEIFSHADTVCMHAMEAPAAFECGYYGKEGQDSHIDGKPSVGVHLSVEADSLSGLDFIDPPEKRWVSGAMCFDFPDLEAEASHDITMILSIRSESTFAAPKPVVRIIDSRIEGSDFVVDFEETTGAPLDGFLLHSSKNMSGVFPDDWKNEPIPRSIDVPYPGASRYMVPIDRTANPSCFFIIEPFLE